MRVGTVALSSAELPATERLAASLGGPPLTVLLATGTAPASPPASCEAVAAADLGIHQLGQLAAVYDEPSLRIALGDWLIRHLLAAGDGGAMIVDPHTEVVGPLDAIPPAGLATDDAIALPGDELTQNVLHFWTERVTHRLPLRPLSAWAPLVPTGPSPVRRRAGAAAGSPFETLPSGHPLSPFLRAALRRWLLEAAGPDADPFSAGGEAGFAAWCHRPAGWAGRVGVTALVETAWDEREELRARFPDLDDPRHARGLLAWFGAEGADVLGVPGALVPLQCRPVPPLAVDVVSGPSGEARTLARGLRTALEAAGAGPAVPGDAAGPTRRVTLACGETGDLPALAAPDGVTVGLVTGAAGVSDAVGGLAEVWAAGSVPHPAAIPTGLRGDRAALGLPAGFLFVSGAEPGTGPGRAGALTLIEAFRRAFPPAGDDVTLVVLAGHAGDPASLDGLRTAARDAAVRVLEGRLGADERLRVVASCDAYVSVDRTPAAATAVLEAMALGLPVAAAGGAGGVGESTGFPIASEAGPDHLAGVLRAIRDDAGEAAARAARAAALVRRHHAPAAVGAVLAHRLSEVAGG